MLDYSRKSLTEFEIVNTLQMTLHGRSQGVQWMHLHPPGRRKILVVIYRENW